MRPTDKLCWAYLVAAIRVGQGYGHIFGAGIESVTDNFNLIIGTGDYLGKGRADLREQEVKIYRICDEGSTLYAQIRY